MQLVHRALLRQYLRPLPLQLKLQLVIIQARQHLPSLDRIPFIHQHLRDAVTLSKCHGDFAYIHITGQCQRVRCFRLHALLMCVPRITAQAKHSHECQCDSTLFPAHLHHPQLHFHALLKFKS